MLRKHEPVSEEQMNWVSPKNTICETIRQAYHIIDNEEARLKLRIATAMAKSMSKKLTQYSEEWKKGFWEPNPNFKNTVKEICENQKMREMWRCPPHSGD